MFDPGDDHPDGSFAAGCLWALAAYALAGLALGLVWLACR